MQYDSYCRIILSGTKIGLIHAHHTCNDIKRFHIAKVNCVCGEQVWETAFQGGCMGMIYRVFLIAI